MYRFVIFGIFVVTALAAVDKRECQKIFDPNLIRCCKKATDSLVKHLEKEEFKECFQVNMDPALCEHDLCLAKKQGVATADNKLDKKKLEEMIDKDLAYDANLLKDVKSKCFDGDIVEYGPPEFCDFLKMKLCITTQTLKNCPEWNDNDACKEYKGLVQECGKTIF